MNHGQRQIIAEKISSTVRVLELLGLDYSVAAPKNARKKGNKSPRVIRIRSGDVMGLRIYNSVGGHTWANEASGKPIPHIGSIETLYSYLQSREQRKKKRATRTARKA
jgi:hypothetical protein